MTTMTFGVHGMTCGHCEMAVVREITKITGVTGAAASADAGTVEVTSDGPLDPAAVAAAVAEAGYELAG